VDREWGLLCIMSPIEELHGRKSSGSGLEIEITAVGICRADHATPSICKTLALTSPTSGCHSVDIVRSWTKATELSITFWICSDEKRGSLERESEFLFVNERLMFQ
jgi:hypothetical protein